MPGLTTHTYIFYKALNSYATSSELFKSVRKSHDVALSYARNNEHLELQKSDECVLAGTGYIGACGPDLFYLEDTDKGVFIADLVHYNKPSLYVISILREIKRSKAALKANLRPDLLRQFAYCLGHVSHIAADITTHPYVNSIVQSYPDNEKIFEDARGMNTKNIWKFHNILEQYQDAYVLHRRFRGMESFGEHWRCVNIAAAGARHFRNNPLEFFLLKSTKSFYKFTRSYSADLELWKFNFFTDDNWLIDVQNYYNTTLPTEEMMTACPQLVQGGIYGEDGSLKTPGVFDLYLSAAVAQTKVFWKEVESYFAAAQKDFDDPQMRPEKQHFTSLRRHWNLDTGLEPWADAATRDLTRPGAVPMRFKVAGTIGYRSLNKGQKDDVQR